MSTSTRGVRISYPPPSAFVSYRYIRMPTFIITTSVVGIILINVYVDRLNYLKNLASPPQLYLCRLGLADVDFDRLDFISVNVNHRYVILSDQSFSLTGLVEMLVNFKVGRPYLLNV